VAEDDASVSNLFKEIDDDLRQDKATLLWKKYGNSFIGVIIALIISVAVFEGWKSYDLDQRSELGEKYETALNLSREDNFDDASKAFLALAGEADGGYAVLSRFQEAGLFARQGKAHEAANAYFLLSKDNTVKTVYRDMAIVLGALNGLDALESSDIISRLEPLIGGTNPWRHSATEITAFAESKAGNKVKAAQLMQSLADDASTPAGIRQRAVEFAKAYSN